MSDLVGNHEDHFSGDRDHNNADQDQEQSD